MVIHIKNINASHERVENFLNQLKPKFEPNKTDSTKGVYWTRIKDTYTISNATESEYESMVEFQDELKEEEDTTIFVKKNGL